MSVESGGGVHREAAEGHQNHEAHVVPEHDLEQLVVSRAREKEAHEVSDTVIHEMPAEFEEIEHVPPKSGSLFRRALEKIRIGVARRKEGDHGRPHKLYLQNERNQLRDGSSEPEDALESESTAPSASEGGKDSPHDVMPEDTKRKLEQMSQEMKERDRLGKIQEVFPEELQKLSSRDDLDREELEKRAFENASRRVDLKTRNASHIEEYQKSTNEIDTGASQRVKDEALQYQKDLDELQGEGYGARNLHTVARARQKDRLQAAEDDATQSGNDAGEKEEKDDNEQKIQVLNRRREQLEEEMAKSGKPGLQKIPKFFKRSK